MAQRAKLIYKGGPGSGHHGHSGRPGKVGGSSAGGGSGGGSGGWTSAGQGEAGPNYRMEKDGLVSVVHSVKDGNDQYYRAWISPVSNLDRTYYPPDQFSSAERMMKYMENNWQSYVDKFNTPLPKPKPQKRTPRPLTQYNA